MAKTTARNRSDPKKSAPFLPDAGEARRIHTALLDWYRRGHRDLPWRKTSDPYAIWVSEIMLQQTRVDTVKERFQQFMARFPTVTALAQAPLEDVLSLWSGLGYYARARNLHAAAHELVARYGGRVPDDPAAVRELPGIGPYTAGAILSIAFGKRAAILDGNVIRVLARLFAIEEFPAGEGATRRRYWALSESLLPPLAPAAGENDVGDFNQALMELGATICSPQRPVCLVCPISELCQARKSGDAARYPLRQAARPVPVVHALTLVLSRPGGEVLLLRRPPSGLWGGLWEPPTLTLNPDENERSGLLRLGREVLSLSPALPLEKLLAQAEPLPPFVHVLTHREMRFTPYKLHLATAPPPAFHLSGYEASRWIFAGEPLALGIASWVSALLARVAPTAAQTASG
jgi:A/G-specific adenine glycosylase